VSNHEFKVLDDKEFEILCCQLLSKVHGKRFEYFKRGRDAGVDGRYFNAENTEVVLQCKHWARSSVEALFRSLRNSEFAKVEKLNPARYILATSLELGRKDKKKIAAIFGGFIKNEDDVLGWEDLNQLIGDNPEIVRQHPKLWLSSAEVIGFIQNAAILGRSQYSLQDIRERAVRYVRTANHQLAKDKLEALGTVLITGLPGIGKTTLAEQLSLEYVLAGYELCVLGDSIEEVENVYKTDCEQIFYFDDFLGSNYLEALDRHEDSRIVGFIKRVSKDPKKRFILTSRATVLNQAKILSDRFAIANLDKNEFEIRVTSLEAIDKARILHNHIWYSDLAPELVDQILSGKRYREIIDHKNFNPRLIQFITDAQRFTDRDHSEYWNYVTQNLAEPSAIWEHVYESQLDDYSRAMLLLVTFNGGPLAEVDLRSAFERFRNDSAAKSFKGSSDFVRVAKVVTGSVLNKVVKQRGVSTYSLFNPSIADYVLTRAPRDSSITEALFLALDTYESLRTLESIEDRGFIPKAQYSQLLTRLAVQKLMDADKIFLYRLKLAEMCMHFGNTDQTVKDILLEFLKSITDMEESLYHWDLLFDSLLAAIKIELLDVSEIPQFFALFEGETLDESDIESLAKLYMALSMTEKQLLEPILREKITEFWIENLRDAVTENQSLEEYLSEDDADEVKQEIESMVQSFLDEYPITFAYYEIEDIAANVDPCSVIESNLRMKRQSHRHVYSEPKVPTVKIDAIDDLFNVDFPR